MTPHQPQSPARRRLAKGALASSAVLASLMSKDALATYSQITCSGKQSGNLSKHNHVDQNCHQKGFSNLHWRNNVCTATNPKPLPAFLGSFFGKGTGANAVRAAVRGKGSGWTQLTCHQLLWGRDDPTSRIPNVEFVVKTLCVYLNAEKDGYYISTDDCINLYKSATSGLGWQKQSSSGFKLMSSASEDAVTWGPEESRAHIETLYY